MTSSFEIYDLKVRFYGSPNNYYYIQHGENIIHLEDAKKIRKFIENGLPIFPNHVYESLVNKMLASGYDIKHFNNTNYKFTDEDLAKNYWHGKKTGEHIKNIEQKNKNYEIINSISGDFWGNLLVGEIIYV